MRFGKFLKVKNWGGGQNKWGSKAWANYVPINSNTRVSRDITTNNCYLEYCIFMSLFGQPSHGTKFVVDFL